MNLYVFKDDVCILTVINKIQREFKFLIDSEDYPRVRMFKWYVGIKKKEGPYCRANIRSFKKTEYIMLHKLISSFEFKTVDHINGNTLDNRKCNLRDGSGGLNQRNRKKSYSKSLPLGVYKSGNKFRSRCRFNGKYYELGTYQTIEEAEKAYLNFREATSKL